MRHQFPDAQSAIRAACELEGNPGRPLASRMLDKVVISAGGWEYVAIRAGIIWQTLRPLKGVPIAMLVARSSPRHSRCACRRPCCSGRQPHPYWLEAIDILCAGALSAGIGVKRYDERRLLLLSVFGERASNKAIADELQIDEHTVGDHRKKIEGWIGVRAKNGNESQAWAESERLLSAAGLLEIPSEK